MNSGKTRRLRRIMQQDNHTVIVPMDHGVTVGPIQGITNMQQITDQLVKGKADAILVHKGIAKRIDTRQRRINRYVLRHVKPEPKHKRQSPSLQRPRSNTHRRRRSLSTCKCWCTRRRQNAPEPWQSLRGMRHLRYSTLSYDVSAGTKNPKRTRT